FAPLIGKGLLKPPKSGGEGKPSRIVDGYAAFLALAIRARWVTIGLTVAAFVGALLLSQYVPRQFFPSSDRPELSVDLTLRQNASIFATEAQAKRFEAVLDAEPDVDHYSSYVGRGAIRFILTFNVQLANPFFAQFIVVAKDFDARERLQGKLETVLAEEFPEVVSRVSPLELGPPVGWPLQYRISGPDPDEVRRLALDFANLLASDPRARHVHYDWMEPARQVRLRVDQDEARRLGVSSRTLSAVLNAALTGTGITQLRDDIYLINVVARAIDSERVSFESLAAIQVPTPSGATVPLKQFASFTEEQEFPLIWRRDRVPTLTVRADVIAGVLPDEVVGALAPRVEEFGAGLPAQYHVEVGGIYEESELSSSSVFAVVPIMIVLMLSIMMVMLVSFRRLVMVILLLPLGLIGVVLALLVSGRPLGFVAILGILALIGMIAKNAVILVVQIETDRGEGKGVREAVMAAATSRMRPLMLAAFSTVLGLIPIAPTVFWGPMAFAIMGGLVVATVLTLVLLPVLYVTVARRGSARVARGRDAPALQFPGSGAIPGARPRPQSAGVYRRLGPGDARQRPAGTRRAPGPGSRRARGRRDARRRGPQLLHPVRGRGAAAPAAAVSRRQGEPAHRPRLPCRCVAGRRVRQEPRRQGRLRRHHHGNLRDRWLGGTVAAARDLPLRMVADP
ncbi:MAG: efflux RND transporter permease subunit, partial [Gammaproteobacteria bacterium]|nr:efflux RND transporter permease subunit [Gammaproteobacteria bacterium]